MDVSIDVPIWRHTVNDRAMIVLKMEGGGGGGVEWRGERFGLAMIMTRKVIIQSPMESLSFLPLCVCVYLRARGVVLILHVSQWCCIPSPLAIINFSLFLPKPTPFLTLLTVATLHPIMAVSFTNTSLSFSKQPIFFNLQSISFVTVNKIATQKKKSK